MPKLVIRRMRKKDAPAVAQLMKELAAFHGDKAASNTQMFLTTCFAPNKLAEAWVAVAGQHIVGFALTYDRADFVQGILTRTLDLLYVKEAWRQRHVASALFAAVANKAIGDKIAKLSIHAVTANKVANSFYRRIGLASSAQERKHTSYYADKKILQKLAKNDGL